MAHEVFISYSTRDSLDKRMADAVCARLEAQQIRCWIAPRDVLPGPLYAASIIEAINGSKLLVLVFSTRADQSGQVLREVERAVSKGIPIIPFRIEDVLPSGAMEYYIAAAHWLDALTPPVEAHLTRLAETVDVLLGRTPGAVDRNKANVEPASAVATDQPRPAGLELNQIVTGRIRRVTDFGAAPTADQTQRSGGAVLAEATIIRRDGSRERYQTISLMNRYGQSAFEIALDAEGGNIREIDLKAITRIEILGPSSVMNADGTLHKRCWPLARIHLVSGTELDNVYVNPQGAGGGWTWSYDTGVWRGKIDDGVAEIILAPAVG